MGQYTKEQWREYMKKYKNRIPEYLEPNEVEALIRHADDVDAIQGLALRLGWRAGLRVSEITNLTPNDVHYASEPSGADGTLKVRLGKGSKDRIVPLHPELARELKQFSRYNKRKGAEPFINRHTQSVYVWVKKAYQSAVDAGDVLDGQKVSTHTLRHSFARYALDNGVPINTVGRWLGHNRLETTLIYLKTLNDRPELMAALP